MFLNLDDRQKKIVKFAYDMFLIALFGMMAWYCANTNCYDVTDQFGNPISKSEIKEMLKRYVNEKNIQSIPNLGNITDYKIDNHTH